MRKRMRRLWRGGSALLAFVLAAAGIFPVNGQAAAASAGETADNGSSTGLLVEDGMYEDGIYAGTGTGYGGNITVQVMIENHVISDVMVTEQQETPAYWEKAESMLDGFLGQTSAEAADIVSGATRSCSGIRSAVGSALKKASPVMDGNGTEGDPFVIYNARQLRSFAAGVRSGDTSYTEAEVRLGADIDLSGAGSWDPIGNTDRTRRNCLYGGTFDGRDYTISGLSIGGTYVESSSLGLFSALKAGAEVRNLHLTGLSVEVSAEGEASVCAGGITGEVLSSADDTAVIDNCSAEGSIELSDTGAGALYGGGLAGRTINHAILINGSAEVDVSLRSEEGTNAYAGGIAGVCGNHTLAANLISTGNVVCETPRAADNTGVAGGLAGSFAGMMFNVCCSGDVTLRQGASENRYAGLVTGQINPAPESSETVFWKYVYYTSDASLLVEICDVNNPERLNVPAAAGTGVSYDDRFEAAAEAIAPAELESRDFTDRLTGSIGDVKKLIDLCGYEDIPLREWSGEGAALRPSGPVWVSGQIDPSVFAGGSGTEEDPFIIETADQLRAFAASLNDRIDYYGIYVRLGEDIDIAGADWEPAGGSSFEFQGDFNGDGHAVSGLTEGSASEPRALDADSSRIGLFGRLGEYASIHDLTLSGLEIYTHSPGSAYIGGIAGQMTGSRTEGDYRGTRIDSCRVSGTIIHISDRGTSFVGGICGHVFKGSIINTITDVRIDAAEKSGELIEAGGIAGLLNRGLIANCCARGDLRGSGYRDTQYDIEGMACLGSIAAVDGGVIVNCCGMGGAEALEYSIDTGILAGWVTGIGKAYSCWYDQDAIMIIDGRRVIPADPFGEITAGGVSDEYGFRFPGALTDNINAFEPGGEGAAQAAAGLNASFEAFPVDMEKEYGLTPDALKIWVVEGESPVPAGGRSSIVYVRPDVEKELQDEPEKQMQDGLWYGRSADGSTVVSIRVEDGEIVENRVLQGTGDGEAMEEAVRRASEKAVYGDDTDYAPADGSRFRGNGTEVDPYRVETEEQLRYLASSINEDVDWRDVYFLQTADITVSDEDWLPIGRGIFADADNDGFGQDAVALYPFRGNYDGGGHVIRGLRAGTEEEPVRTAYMGLFGIVQGDYISNEIPESGAGQAVLKNIRLEDVSFHTENRWRSYASGLVGNAQGGFVIDCCRVSGSVSSRSAEDFSFAGGLSGSLMYGCVSDCCTDVDVRTWSGRSYSYAAGLSAVTNRATVVNSCALGDVHGDAEQTNRAEAGGFIGLDGGICLNCYAAGSVEIVSKYSMYLGGFVGMAASSSEHRQCYYNSDADQKTAGEDVPEKRYAGKFVNESTESAEQAKTEAFMFSEAFRKLLNTNREQADETTAQIRETLETDDRGSSAYHSVYFSGDPAELQTWLWRGGDAVPASYVPVGTRYRDVDESRWYTQAIRLASDLDWMNGTGEREFSPDGTVTRAMFVTVLSRVAGIDAQQYEGRVFLDVPEDRWFSAPIRWAAETGIVNGTGEQCFSPDDPVTREQMAAMLYRFACRLGDVPDPDPSIYSGFEDREDVSDWAEEAMIWACAAGIIRGTDLGLEPRSTATRAQAAQIIIRFRPYVISLRF